MNMVVVVQARMGSSRLPAKVMMPLAGRTLLERMIDRVRAAALVRTVVVATTTEPADDAIRAFCGQLGIACYSGSRDDLLDRHYQAGLLHDADAVVKIPSDCPLIDPAVIDRVLDRYLRSPTRPDFVSNLHPPSYPDGHDVEVISMPALQAAWRLASQPFEREHTTPYLWERPESFRIENVTWETGLDYSMSHRWTIDYPEDYEFIAEVYNQLTPTHGPCFGIAAVLDLLERRPAIAAINASLAGVNWYRHHLGELRTIGAGMTRGTP